MISTSDLNGVSTNGDAAVTVLPGRASAYADGRESLTVVNESGVKVFLSIDNGASWFPMPAGTGPQTLTLRELNQPLGKGVLAKRVPGGTNVTGLYAYTH